MRTQGIDRLFRKFVLLAVLAASCGNVWAVASICSYPQSGIETGGTGMGGTGVVAKGTGMGGTGISPVTGMQLAGKVIFSKGAVEAQSNGRSRLLAKGDPVCVGETIATSQSGTLQIRMTDDGLVAVRPQTQLKIEKFAYSGTDKDASLFTLFKGAGRFVTGKIGKRHPQNDLILTQTATIGVRGTDHEATVILPGDSSGYPSGTYDKVNKGITFIRTEKGEIDIHPNQVGVAASIGEMPGLLKDIPDFYKTDPSVKEEGSSFEEGKKEEGEGLGDKKIEGPSQGPAGEETEFTHPLETGTSAGELPGNPDSVEIPESPALPELPESPALPDIPEHPEN